MLSISIETVAEIIILARELDRAEAEFDAFIGSLNDDEKAEVVALMWVGRGSFDAEDWAEAKATATEEATTPTAEYLKGSPHLADHLENGLDTLGIAARNAEDSLY